MISVAERGWQPAPDRYLKIVEQHFYRTLVDLQDLVTVVTTEFWRRRGVKALHLPITTTSISSPMGLGSDSEPVEIDLHGQRTYLADSMQFMLEYGCRFSRSGTWYLMPSFRGESADHTHLNQFFHSEAEIVGSLDDVMDVVEDYMRALARGVLEHLAADVAEIAGGIGHVEHMAALTRFPRMTLDEAAGFLGDDPDAIAWHQNWRSVTRHGEWRLLQEVGPVIWLTHFDGLSVPFYQAWEDGTGQRTLTADLLFGSGESVGAGERHRTGDQVRAALARHHVAEEPYRWYVDLKDTHPMRTSGFGMGVERWLMWVLNHSDIRELQLVPRLNGVATAP